MSDEIVNPGLQPAIPNVPESEIAPGAYISAANAVAQLTNRYPQYSTLPNGAELPVAEGVILAASMSLDEEGPWFGVKFDVTQERSWPRTFRYGWPNMIATPAPVLVTLQRPGAFYLNYEGVVPQQIIDYVCLEYYRMLAYPSDVTTVSESVTGASVHYSQWTGQPGTIPAQLDRIMSALISPFQATEAHTDAFVSLSNL
jgi:hypothetical protein